MYLHLNHFRKKFLLVGVMVLCICSLVITASALPNDQSQPMQVNADSSLINYKTGVNTYEGHVKIDQGSSHLTSDRLVTKNDNHHKMSEAIAYGDKQLAEYTTIPNPGDKLLHAKANVIRFYPQKSLVILEGNVTVLQGENSFHGPMITYNIKDQIVTAPANQKGQATIIINPT